MLHTKGAHGISRQPRNVVGNGPKQSAVLVSSHAALAEDLHPQREGVFSICFLLRPLIPILPPYCKKPSCTSVTSHRCRGLLLAPQSHPFSSPTAFPPGKTTSLTSFVVALVQLTSFLLGWSKLDANQVSRKGIDNSSWSAGYLPNTFSSKVGEKEEQSKKYTWPSKPEFLALTATAQGCRNPWLCQTREPIFTFTKEENSTSNITTALQKDDPPKSNQTLPSQHPTDQYTVLWMQL